MWVFRAQCCFIVHSMALRQLLILTKPSNMALLLEKKQMLTRLCKFLSEFPRLEGFGLITRVNNSSHTRV